MTVAFASLRGRWEQLLAEYTTCSVGRLAAARAGGVLRVEAGELHMRQQITDEEWQETRTWVLPVFFMDPCEAAGREAPSADKDADVVADVLEGVDTDRYADPGLWQRFVDELRRTWGAVAESPEMTGLVTDLRTKIGELSTGAKWAVGGAALLAVGLMLLPRR